MAKNAYGDSDKKQVKPTDTSTVNGIEAGTANDKTVKVYAPDHLKKDNPNVLERKDLVIPVNPSPGVPKEALQGYRTVQTDFGPKPPMKYA